MVLRIFRHSTHNELIESFPIKGHLTNKIVKLNTDNTHYVFVLSFFFIIENLNKRHYNKVWLTITKNCQMTEPKVTLEYFYIFFLSPGSRQVL